MTVYVSRSLVRCKAHVKVSDASSLAGAAMEMGLHSAKQTWNLKRSSL